ncbi:MAG: photosynthetic complex assembly protein PuhC [Burkholderiaceae bacterium]
MNSRATTPSHPRAPGVARSTTSPLPWAVAVLALLGLALWHSETNDAATASGSASAPATATGAPGHAASPELAPGSVQGRRWLRFEDRPNGDVVAIDVRSGSETARYQGEQGFLRGTLRAVARERSRHGISPDRPLELVAHDHGRLSLIDPATGQRIALESFGASNLAVFAALLDDGPTQSTPARSTP